MILASPVPYCTNRATVTSFIQIKSEPVATPSKKKLPTKKVFGILQETQNNKAEPTCAHARMNHHSNDCVRCLKSQSDIHQSKVISYRAPQRPGGHGACAKRKRLFSHFKCAEELKTLGVTELKPQVTLVPSQRAELP